MCCKTVKCLFDIVTFHDQTTKGDSTKEPPFSFAKMCELNKMSSREGGVTIHDIAQQYLG